MTSPMHWTPVGPKGNKSGLYSIGGNMVMGKRKYSLHYKDESLGYFDEPTQAIDAAEAHRKGRKP